MTIHADIRPPALARWLFRRLIRDDEGLFIDGDFDEEFSQIVESDSVRSARIWYWKHVLASLPALVWETTYWRTVMFKNYLKVALRQIQKKKGFALINITGLAIGLAVCSLIMLWVLDEVSYDRFHQNGKQIYRLIMDADIGGHIRTPATMPPAGPTMTEEYPEVENFTRIGRLQNTTVRWGDTQFQETLVGFADPSFFEIFSFPFTSGDAATALTRPNTIVVTQEMAAKYFGESDPVGQILRIGGEEDYTVTGVVTNVPRNSTIQFNMLRSFETLLIERPVLRDAWFSIEFTTYLLLSDDADWKAVEGKFPDLVDRMLGEQLRAVGGRMELLLQPMTRIHLFSDRDFDVRSAGDIRYVYLFSGIALFVLLIACINFINLSTARSATRAREVGMRKTLGALQRKLVIQFLGESVLLSLMAMVLAAIFIALALPLFSNLVGRPLSVHLLQRIWILPSFIGLALLVGVLAGGYPAFVLSAFHPVHSLKGGQKEGKSSALFRKILVVVQFAVSITLIVGTLTVFRQIEFIRNRRLGFDQEQVVVMPRLNETLRRAIPSIKEELAQVPGVTHVGASTNLPGFGNIVGIFLPEGFPEDQQQTMHFFVVDHDFIPTLKMELAQGRNFSAALVTDTSESVIINETAARQFGWGEPLGKTFIFRPPPGREGETQIMRVVGVLKDFHMGSLREEIPPFILFYDPLNLRRISVRIASDRVSQTLDGLRAAWAKIDPDGEFDYRFLDERLHSLYESEERIGRIALNFTVLAVLIGCLGLFGLAAFMAEKRTKEIGIRKVLGATTPGIVGLMSREFLILVGLANVIAWPLAWWGMTEWLKGYAYRAGMGWWIFAVSTVLALFIALATVSVQALKAARANPVDAIRYE